MWLVRVDNHFVWLKALIKCFQIKSGVDFVFSFEDLLSQFFRRHSVKVFFYSYFKRVIGSDVREWFDAVGGKFSVIPL
jgi:hypothetical protein